MFLRHFIRARLRVILKSGIYYMDGSQGSSQKILKAGILE